MKQAEGLLPMDKEGTREFVLNAELLHVVFEVPNPFRVTRAEETCSSPPPISQLGVSAMEMDSVCGA